MLKESLIFLDEKLARGVWNVDPSCWVQSPEWGQLLASWLLSYTSHYQDQHGSRISLGLCLTAVFKP